MKKIPLLVLNLFLYCSAFAQAKHYEAEAIASNHLTERRTYRYPVNADGSYGPRFKIYAVIYNNHGRPLVQERFDRDGLLTDKYVSDYLADSLETRMTSYDGKGNIATESVYQYDNKGNRVYSRQTLKSIGRTIEQFRIYNSLNQLTELYTSTDGKKKLTMTWEYDSAGNPVKSVILSGPTDKKDTGVSEFDAHGNLLRNYEKFGDSIRINVEMVYNTQYQLLERRNFFHAPVTILSDAGEKETLQKSDTHLTRFTYDNRGLLMAEMETLNGKEVFKLEYEYSSSAANTLPEKY